MSILSSSLTAGSAISKIAIGSHKPVDSKPSSFVLRTGVHSPSGESASRPVSRSSSALRPLLGQQQIRSTQERWRLFGVEVVPFVVEFEVAVPRLTPAFW